MTKVRFPAIYSLLLFEMTTPFSRIRNGIKSVRKKGEMLCKTKFSQSEIGLNFISISKDNK